MRRGKMLDEKVVATGFGTRARQSDTRTLIWKLGTDNFPLGGSTPARYRLGAYLAARRKSVRTKNRKPCLVHFLVCCINATYVS